MRWPTVFAGWRAVIYVALATLASCRESVTSGPFDGLPLDGDFAADVSAPVHVARDRDGVAHIRARTIGDAAFVQGYVMAHDRLPQMDALRRIGAGTLAELYGDEDPSVIDGDLELRLQRMQPRARETWTALQASSDPADQEVVELLGRFAAGVNAYTSDLQHQLWTLDPATRFDPATFPAWSAVDSLVIARLQAFAQSFTVPFELDASELYQQLRAFYDAAPSTNPAAVARHGISRDLWRLAPIGSEPTIAGFPNVDADTGTRAGGSARAAPADAAITRPVVPLQAFADARTLFTRQLHDGPLGALGSHALGQPAAGGNAWAVGAPLAGGSALLAADPHLPLADPALYYPTHLMVKSRDADADSDADDGSAADVLDVIGLTIPGIPGVLLGANRDVAWAGTASEHDVNDVYLEHLAPCGDGTGDCAAWTDAGGIPRSVALAADDQAIRVGTRGQISRTIQVRYEIVPHHGPIIPAIDPASHTLVPRTAATALAFRYTGYDRPTFELRAFARLAHATSVDDGLHALADVTYGSQGFVLIDRAQRVAWTTEALVPIRNPAAYAWDPLVDQDALAPFFVLPGNGDGDWQVDPAASDAGSPPAALAMSPRYLPHAIDPAPGFVVAANADPVGATFDGKPLDQRTADGAPLYAGVAYAAGLRQDRIAALLRAGQAAGPITLDTLAAIQRDTHSSVGEKFAPMLLAALGRLDRQLVGPPDVNPYLDALPPEDLARLATARALLARWTFATPAAPVDAADGDSAATAVLNTWMHYFIERTLADELAAIGFDVWRLADEQLVRVIYAMLHDPNSFVTSPATQQPILCDNYAVAGPDDSCTKAVLQAMVDAMAHLASADGFGSADPAAWQWGALHRLARMPLGQPAQATATSVPRPGDNFAIDRSDCGWADLAFSARTDRAAQLLVEAAPGQPLAVAWGLAGGAIADARSAHDHDLLDRLLAGQPTPAAVAIDQIVAAGESRWVFH